MFQSKRRRIALITVLAIAAFGGTAFAIASAETIGHNPVAVVTPVQLAPAVGQLPNVPGTADEVVASLAAQFPLVSNVRVVTRAIPPHDDSPDTTNVQIVTYDLPVYSNSGPDITEALWQGDLLAGVLADEYLARGFGQLSGAQATLVTPDGQRQFVGGGIVNVVADQVFDPIPEGLSETLASNAAQMGLTDVRVETVHALQDAIEVTATASDPKSAIVAFSTTGGLAALVGENPDDFEGVLLRIDDTSGVPVFFVGLAPRDGLSVSWTDPSLSTSS